MRLLARRNGAEGVEKEEERGRLAGSKHQTPTQATGASENPISPRSQEVTAWGWRKPGTTKNRWTENKIGGEKHGRPSRGEISLQMTLFQSIPWRRSGTF